MNILHSTVSELYQDSAGEAMAKAYKRFVWLISFKNNFKTPCKLQHQNRKKSMKNMNNNKCLHPVNIRMKFGVFFSFNQWCSSVHDQWRITAQEANNSHLVVNVPKFSGNKCKLKLDTPNPPLFGTQEQICYGLELRHRASMKAIGNIGELFPVIIVIKSHMLLLLLLSNPFINSSCLINPTLHLILLFILTQM